MNRLRSTFGLSLLAGLLFWLSIPPCDFWLLAWIAPVPWVLLVRQQRLEGRRPYLSIWIAGFLFWLAALYWLTLPHWATSFGWLALSFYLAFYMPAFVGLARVAVHQWRWPVILVAPVIWVGLEFVRSYLLTGFMMVVIGQTQYQWITLIQVADLFGAYGVSFLVLLVAACLARMIPWGGSRIVWWPIMPAVVAIAAALGYGWFRTSGDYLQPGPKVALIQGSIDTTLKADPAQNSVIFDHYFKLTLQAIRRAADLDLIVWPETMFRYSWFTFDDDYKPSADEKFTSDQLEAASHQAVENVVLPLRVPMLLGIDNVNHTNRGTERFNAALLVDRDGSVLGKYAKTHLVMFGEYVPFAKQYPFLYKLTPLGAGLTRGKTAQAIESHGVVYSPNICFETTLARVIRRLVNEGRNAVGKEPQVLVNLTNDGWFWGSSELDLHLICGVFRAVECRKPLLIAANTGFSGWIDSDGRIVQQGHRRAEGVLIARPGLDTRHSFYLRYGDLFCLPCLAICTIATIAGLRTAIKSRKPRVGG
jgi:apolipoprotein N-acyltransferase